MTADKRVLGWLITWFSGWGIPFHLISIILWFLLLLLPLLLLLYVLCVRMLYINICFFFWSINKSKCFEKKEKGEKKKREEKSAGNGIYYWTVQNVKTVFKALITDRYISVCVCTALSVCVCVCVCICICVNVSVGTFFFC